MQRFDYRIKEFTRHSWRNPDMKKVWEPRFREARACIDELEWRSIVEGVRSCALRAVAPNDLQASRARLAPYGLIVTPLEKIAAEDGYGSSLRAAHADERFNHWCAIGRVSNVRLIRSAHLSHDDEAVGQFLGYPPCCTRFHDLVRFEEGFMDTTWPMAQNTTQKRDISSAHIEIAEVSRCNVLLRWLGLKMVFHLPCCFDCPPTVEIADKLVEIALVEGFRQEIDWLEEMSAWPVEWSALYGLAEITTPVGTITTVTDATAERYRVSYRGGEISEGRGTDHQMES